MKNFVFSFMLPAVFLCLAVCVKCGYTAEAAKVEKCPVLGVKINEATKVSYEYEGKKYDFCCKECVEVFKKNPDKFIKEGEIDAGKTICPVLGVKINEATKVSYEYKGKMYDFCCKECIDVFKKDPDKFIKEGEVDTGGMKCPVLGVKINEATKVSYEYKGKMYDFCCKECVDVFKKDPDKFIKESEVDAGGMKCPVLGVKINEATKISYEHKGKMYDFCCKECVDVFKKDPDKFIKEGEVDAGSMKCPVLGVKINEATKISYEHKGKMYDFCCKECVDVFKKDPDKFIKEGEVSAGGMKCPVLGVKINEATKVSYEYKGKMYDFCCKECVDIFKKNPDKYIREGSVPVPGK
ncbi:MAG: YHS domain-containing protein [Elusimicrobia bacterium]|nr:YHS domain-containing protein [Candidatus Liberimonas magnetica]